MRSARALLQRAGTIPLQREIVPGAVTGINAINLNQTDKGVAQVSIAIKAGSRHELNDGVAYSLAMCKNNSSESHTEYLQRQTLDRAGAEYTAKVTRDHIVYTLKCGPRLASEMFSDVVLPGLFCNNNWDWELLEKEHNMKKVLDHLSKSEKHLDLLHQVSFKSGGLNRSVNPAGYRLGKGFFRKSDHPDVSGFYWPIPQLYETRVKQEEVTAYRDLTFTHDNITIFTANVPEDEAQAIVDSVAAYTAPGGARDAGVSAFVGGESRVPSGDLPSGMLGFPGAAAGSKDQGSYAIIAQAIGGQSLNYEGAGLLACSFTDPRNVLESLKNLSDAQIDAAREIVESEYQFNSDSFDGAVAQHLSANAGDFSANNQQIKNLAASLAKGAKSMVIEGQIGSSPFLADL